MPEQIRDHTGAATVRREPCTANGYHEGMYQSSMFEGCPTCGHARIMHPGRHNPALESCALCRLEGTIDDLQERKP